MILDTLADYARMRVAQLKKDKPLLEIKQAALALPTGDFVFEKVLRSSGISIIAEIKKASPSKVLGADAVLLICALLDVATIKYYLKICDLLGLTALVETHDAQEIAVALDAGARVIGANNRNLKDFTVDIKNSVRLRRLVPEDKIFISESGIKTRSDIASLEEVGVDAVLIGETLMRSCNLKETIAELRGKTNAEN